MDGYSCGNTIKTGSHMDRLEQEDINVHITGDRCKGSSALQLEYVIIFGSVVKINRWHLKTKASDR